ncbi:MAG: HAAS signaling domain-containing protein [Candidatus Heimdallarchaeaceae archaeon]
MSSTQKQEEMINEFLDEVVRKLPLWLKGNPDQRDDVLQELGDHIWDKAEELAQGATPSISHVQEAIKLMGSPREIAREYRRRGTPKFYISEELWPWYIKGLLAVIILTVFSNLIAMAFAFGGELTTSQILIKTLSDIWTGLLVGTFVMTIIFVLLAYHGFLPQDFKKIITTEKKEKTKTIRKEDRKRRKEIRQQKKIISKPGSFLAEGIINLVIGFLLIFFPWESVNKYTEIDLTAFFTWLALFGGIMVISGIIRFSQAIAGRQLRLQQVLYMFYLVPSSLTIALFLRLLQNTAIVIEPLLEAFPLADIHLYAKIIVWFIVVATILGMIDTVSKVIRLEIKGIPELKREIKTYYKL